MVSEFGPRFGFGPRRSDVPTIRGPPEDSASRGGATVFGPVFLRVLSEVLASGSGETSSLVSESDFCSASGRTAIRSPEDLSVTSFIFFARPFLWPNFSCLTTR